MAGETTITSIHPHTHTLRIINTRLVHPALDGGAEQRAADEEGEGGGDGRAVGFGSVDVFGVGVLVGGWGFGVLGLWVLFGLVLVSGL